jgi:iron complex outermembrane recepter protein
MNKVRCTFAAISGLCIALIAPALTSAQSDSSTDNGQIGEIIVTAERHEQRLQDVPISVTALAADSLSQFGVTGIASLQSAVPSMMITNNANIAQPFIRGIGSAIGSANTESSVAIYLDGVYQPAAFGNFFTFNNIERIEVLEGPQGTLFGRNSTAGVIQVITRDPSSTPEAEASVGYGNYRTVYSSTYLSMPISDTLAFNVAAMYTDRREGWGIYNDTGDQTEGDQEQGIRAKLVFRPAESTKITFAADYSHSINGAAFYQNISGSKDLVGHGYPGNFNTWADEPDTNYVVSAGGSVTAEQDFNIFRLTSISAYSKTTGEWRADTDASSIDEDYVIIRDLGEMYTQEFHLFAEPASKFQWQVGAFYINYQAAQPFEGIEGLAVSPFDVFDFRTIVNSESESVFAQGTYPVVQDTNITLGIRETRDLIIGHSSTYVDGDGSLGQAIFGPNTRPELVYTKPTWRMVLDHNFTPDIMAYVSYNRGIKSGNINDGANGAPGVTAAYQPEQLDAYETGLKTELLDRRVRLNSAFYYYNFKDMQYQESFAGGTLVVNAPKAILYGFESQLTARATDNLTLNASVGLEHTRFDNFPNAPSTVRTPEGTTVLGNPDFNAGGNQLPWSPKFTGVIGFSYDVPTTSSGTFVVGSSLYRFGGSPTEIDNRLREDAYNLLSASVGWKAPLGGFDVKLFGSNLTNAYYYTQLTGAAGSTDIATPAAPRTYGIIFKYSYK